MRLIEIMVAAEETDNGGAPATYADALRGPEGKQWQVVLGPLPIVTSAPLVSVPNSHLCASRL